MKSTCRLCARDSPITKITPIFSFRRNRLILDLISILCPIRIDRADNLPQNVCDLCLDLIQNAYELREKSVRSDIDFRNGFFGPLETIEMPSKSSEIVTIKEEVNPFDMAEYGDFDDQSNFSFPEQEEDEDEDDGESGSGDDDGDKYDRCKPSQSKYKIVNSRRYQCPYCDKCFIHSNGVPRHIRLKHKKKKQESDEKSGYRHGKKLDNTCHVCGMGFLYPRNLKRHIKNKHSEFDKSYETSEKSGNSKKSSTDQKEMKNEEFEDALHNFMNQVEGKDDDEEESEEDQTEDDKNDYPVMPPTGKNKYETVRGRYKCPVCPKTFKHINNIPRHLREMHSEDKALYKRIEKTCQVDCHLCGVKFLYNTNLYRHMKNKHPDYQMPPKPPGRSRDRRRSPGPSETQISMMKNEPIMHHNPPLMLTNQPPILHSQLPMISSLPPMINNDSMLLNQPSMPSNENRL